jgi:hypothetical protein
MTLKIIMISILGCVAITGYSQISTMPWQAKSLELDCMSVPVLSKSVVKTFNASNIKNTTGHIEGDNIVVKNGVDWNNLQRGDGGYLAKDVKFICEDEGSLRTIFNIKIDDNRNGVWDKVMRLEVFDHTENIMLTSMDIERNYFREQGKFQNLILYTDLKGRSQHEIEARVWYLGKAGLQLHQISLLMDKFEQGLPVIQNQSSSSTEHIKKLLAQAFDGLGFSKNSYEAPNANDMIYVNDYYMAWIDQTGYYGKMNGLWQLNNKKGNALNFLDNQKVNGRVTNFLAVAEDGDGKWLNSYMGAEHYEIPSYTKEDNDNATTVERGISNWYALNEANPMLGMGGTGPIMWWSCCSGVMNDKQSFAQINLPSEYTQNGNSLQIQYYGALVKSSDADGVYDGDRCQSNFLFYNNIRYPLYLKVGFIFHKDKPYFDRTYQMYNPVGNVALPGYSFMSVIGGMVVSKTPATIAWKKDLFAFIQSNTNLNTTDSFIIKQIQQKKLSEVNGKWVELYYPTDKDIIKGFPAPNSCYTISAEKKFELGKSFYHSVYYIGKPHIGARASVGICDCVVHGGWEIGGGVINGNFTLEPGALSIMAVRRMGFPQGEPIYDDKLESKEQK